MTFPIRPTRSENLAPLSSTRLSSIRQRALAPHLSVCAATLAATTLLYATSSPVFAAPSVTNSAPVAAAPLAVTTPTIAAPDAVASTMTAASDAFPLPTTTPLSAFNILLVPLDHLTNVSSSGATNAQTRIASGVAANDNSSRGVSSGSNMSGGNVSGRDAAIAVGPAEAAAAPLRRALLKRGLSDVLTVAANSPVLRRAVAENRLSQQQLDQLDQAMSIVASATNIAPAETPLATPSLSTAAPAVPAPAAVTPAVPTDNVTGNVTDNVTGNASDNAPDNSFENATQRAVAAASRLGQVLNYRAVVVLTLASDSAGKTHYVMLLVDALRENGDVTSFDVPSANPTIATTNATPSSGTLNTSRLVSYQMSAEVGSTLLQQKLTAWAQAPLGDRNKITADSLETARVALDENRLTDAREALSRVLAFDARQRDALLLLGDVQLKGGDAEAAILSYRRASILDGDQGAAWARLTTSYAAARNWPETLNAGKQALAANADSVALRLAMATAQLGRAQLFTDAGRADSADDALADAALHLAKARQLAPDDPAVLRLLAQQLTMKNQTRQALQMLDRAAPQLAYDRDFQVSYATLLAGRDGRERDAFSAWMRATQLIDSATSSTGSSTGNGASSQLPIVDRARFRRLTEGYDQVVAKMVMRAYTLTEGIVQGNVSRESALLELKPMTSNIALANQVLKSLTPPDDRLHDAYTTRLTLGDTFSQAINAYEMYAENGDDALHDKAVELHKTAMSGLNALRVS